MDDTIATRLVTELMLVSIVVAGEGADTLAQALERAGAAAEPFALANPAGGYDLAVLCAPAGSAAETGQDGLLASLAEASERLLFVPTTSETDAPPGQSGLAAWFETFIELGYQPVVDFDAGFVAHGAFLVDRAATAGEAELAAFADRLHAPPSPPRPDPAPSPQPTPPAELETLRAQLAENERHLADLTARAATAEAALQEAHGQNAGWEGLRAWVNFSVRDPARDCEAALRRDLPRLAALRGDKTLSLESPTPPPPPKTWLGFLFRRAPPPMPEKLRAALEDAALVRASRLFDPAWYIASSAELSAGETVDPVFHYVLVGGLRGADPGPWFDSAAYLAAHPGLAQGGQAPLVHAIRSGAPEAAEGAAPTS
jgi:hypothetical protein